MDDKREEVLQDEEFSGQDSSEALRAEVLQLREENAAMQVKLLRLQADFDNFRRRITSVRQEEGDAARIRTLADLLPVYDNFVRALEHGEENPELLPYLDGFELIRQQLEQYLVDQGLEEVPARIGDPFDPNVHEATGTLVPDDEELGGRVAMLLQRGFTFKGQLVRPANVLVYGD
jgi:molecular chaperone GrpE